MSRVTGRPAEPAAPLSGEVVLVTGASRGIGRAITHALVEAGAKVAMLAQNTRAVRAIHEDLGAAALPVPGDVTRTSDVQRAVGAAEAEFGKLTAVVNNAGIAVYAPIADLAEDAWRDVLNVNLTGAFLVIRASIPALRRAGGGSVLNIGSLAVHHPFPEGAAYTASKAGLLALAETAALELRNDNIRVSTLLPGSVATSITDPDEAQDWKIQPRDVARVAVDLLSLPGHIMPGRVELRPTRVPSERRKGLRTQ